MTRRDALLEFASVALGVALAAAFLASAFGGRTTRWEELGLGRETTPVFAHHEGWPIHCKDVEDAAGCLEGFARRGAQAAALWLGNSQLHGINQYAAGQETAPALLFERRQTLGVETLAFSQPNANLEEHLILYAYLKRRLPLRWVLLPVVFDDLRESGVRGSLAGAIADPAVAELLGESDAGRRILGGKPASSDSDLAGLRETVQERSERFLTGWLDRHSELWKLRPEARGQLFHWLQSLRNSVFGITPSTKRRVIPSDYRANVAALEAMLADAQRDAISVLLYVAPIRSDVELPYVMEEYERFKTEARALCDRYGALFVNLETLVPPGEWGVKIGTRLDAEREIDFMHFRAGGHALLARALEEQLRRAR
jgi:hypothetical protein